ncbi:TPA: class I adenylate-forming enzyme family protein [Burkholderia cepacia]|uniref:class I adenylate-forming enzyme family protein n=1 Tax=Burkholderia cepacia TaxID=292 RepID=UPI001CF3CE8D|nr:class I adenylate-forming enzyme family protein [Burkholderia cepacia]MCA8358208.1 acyl--CoA ligase [Burkholderia cepacia]HDR9759530.1 acyl--CoA ligase [Burkholderia cepacia ATCC 25416]HDV6365821.1 acyl--CoA ligase [Burkholderia cepacia]
MLDAYCGFALQGGVLPAIDQITRITKEGEMNTELEHAWQRRAETEARALPKSLAALFDEAVIRYADRVFWRSVDGDGLELTYRDFGALVDRCAAAFRRFGIGVGTHVALALPNVPAIGAAWIALHKIGAVVLGVNVNLVPSEVSYTLSMADAEVLILDIGYRGLLELESEHTFPVKRERIVVHGGALQGFANWDDLLRDASRAVPAVDVDSRALASILYTSGSMGLPKPAMLPHDWHVISGWVRSRQGPAPRNILVDSPLYYMGGQWRFAMAMYIGATLCVAQKPTLSRYLDRLLAYDIQFCAVSSQTAKLPNDTRYAKLDLSWATSSGLQKEIQAPLEARLGAPVREIYGATEIGSAVVMPVLVKSMVGSGSCGLPDAFRSCRIVDEHGKDVRQGETGELWITGPGIALGYYRSDEATASTFGGGWYRTGDLFVQDSQGFYYWQSRIKDIIRRSKENISAIEVESAIRSFPSVLEVAAIAVPDDYRDEEVKIYVQLVPGETRESVPPARLLEHARAILAAFKLPRYVEYVDTFERTASNKVSKLALKKQKQDLRLDSYDSVDDVWR